MPRGRSRSSSPLTGGAGYWWYLVPGFVLVTAVILVPLAQNVYYSFTYYRGIKPPQWIGLQNWQHLLHDDKFWKSFENSIAMIVAMVIVPTLLGLLIARSSSTWSARSSAARSPASCAPPTTSPRSSRSSSRRS